MGQKEIREEFNRKVGEVLRIALNLEANLEYYIATYFVRPPRNHKNYFQVLSERRTFFEENVLQQLNFEKKKKIFVDICKKEECNPREIRETVKAIDFIQRIRNRVAHWHMTQTKEDEPYLTNKIDIPQEHEKLKLSEKLMDDIAKARFKTVTGIVNLGLECSRKQVERAG